MADLVGGRRSRPSTWLTLLATVVLVVACTPKTPTSSGTIGTTAPPVAQPSSPETTTVIRWPTVSWQVEAPETEGFDSVMLARGLEQLVEAGSRIHSLLIVRHAALVVDAYVYPYDDSVYHDLASVTKSVTTTLTGIAADQGAIDLDASILSFFPDRTIANPSDRKERITVRDLASMSSGLDCTAFGGERTLLRMFDSVDYVQFVLDLGVINEPGTAFSYCSPGMHLLSAILTQATGRSALDFAQQNLFEPLGITDVYWSADSQGISHGWGDLALHPRDAAKLGLLFLQEGRWEDSQLVSSEWVSAATTAQVAANYGYGWWISPPGEEESYFRADGNGGQRILVIPSREFVLVSTGGGFSLDDFTPFLLASITNGWKPLPPNPAGVEELDNVLAALHRGPDAETMSALPAAAAALSGRTILFDSNVVGSVRLDFDGSAQATVTMDVEGEEEIRVMRVGLDGRFRPSREGRPGVARGEWSDATTFIIDIDEGPGFHRYQLRLYFDGDAVELELVGLDEDVVTITGRVED